MTAADVFKRIRFHLNDTPGYYFTDAILLDPLNVALDDLRGELLDNNIPITNAVSTLLVLDAGVTEVGFNTAPELPPNLVEIQEILERSYGTSEVFTPVRKMEFLPESPSINSTLIFWSWQEERIKFSPANSKRELKINYIKDAIPPVVSNASFIDMIRSLPFLSYRSAALAAENLGEDAERAASLNNNAGRELDKLMNLSVKGKQVMPVRRRPFQGSNQRG